MLRRNELGIAVPGIASPLPWKNERGPIFFGPDIEPEEAVTSEEGAVFASDDDIVAEAYDEDDAAFLRHAANYHERLADIVRRIKAWIDGEAADDFGPIVDDAAELWDEMSRDE